MANMSYCRFQNTLQDFLDCYDHMSDTDLSEKEQKARDRMVQLCGDISCEYENDDND